MSTPIVSKIQGTGYRQLQTPTMSPEQQKLFSQLLGQIQPGLTSGLDQLSQQAGGGSEEYWKQQEAPAMRQFQELQGQLGSRFSGLGGTGGRKSSGFQNAAGGAAASLAEQLQSQRQGLQQNAISQLMQLYGNLMGTQTFDTSFLANKQKKKPFWQELLGGAAGGVGSGLGALLGFL